MISDKMVSTLHEIKYMEMKIGVAKAPEIKTYQDKATLYRSLERMEKLGIIDSHPAPKNRRLKQTYTLTQFGKKLLQKSQNLEKEFQPQYTKDERAKQAYA